MDEKSLSHTSWNCKYHIVLVPKYRRKVIYGKLRKDIGKILRMLCDYKHAENGSGDISRRIRLFTWTKGQSPYAIIVTCSDSRVIPENIFSAGIGELFVIRLAGNVIDDHQLGSIEYAAGHLGCRLVVVLGHTHCGAVDAAIHHEPEGYIKYITDEIKKAVGDETDPYKASCLNVRHSVREIEKSLCIHHIEEETGLWVVGAMYHIEDGSVEFL